MMFHDLSLLSSLFFSFFSFCRSVPPVIFHTVWHKCENWEEQDPKYSSADDLVIFHTVWHECENWEEQDPKYSSADDLRKTSTYHKGTRNKCFAPMAKIEQIQD